MMDGGIAADPSAPPSPDGRGSTAPGSGSCLKKSTLGVTSRGAEGGEGDSVTSCDGGGAGLRWIRKIALGAATTGICAEGRCGIRPSGPGRWGTSPLSSDSAGVDGGDAAALAGSGPTGSDVATRRWMRIPASPRRTRCIIAGPRGGETGIGVDWKLAGMTEVAGGTARELVGSGVEVRWIMVGSGLAATDSAVAFTCGDLAVGRG